MKSLLVRLYPGWWRARYGDEFTALLEDGPLGPFEVVDVALAALDARLRPDPVSASSSAGGPTLTMGAGSLAAIWGGILWSGGLLLMLAGDAWQPLGITCHFFGTLAILVALIVLSAGHARDHAVLSWASAALPVLGATLSLGAAAASTQGSDEAVIAGISAWGLWMIGTLATLIGSALFGLTGWRVAGLSRRSALLLAAGALGGVLTVGLGIFGFAESTDWLNVAVQIGVGILGTAAFGIGWVLVGMDVRRPEHIPVTPTRS